MEEAAFEPGLDAWVGRGECARVVEMSIRGCRKEEHLLRACYVPITVLELGLQR